MINTALILFLIVQILILIHLIYPGLLIFLQYFKGETRISPNFVSNSNEIDYAVIVTAYEQVNLIPGVVRSILNLNYQNYMIYVVADNCDISQLSIADPKVVLLRPEHTLSSNIKSHFYAINRFVRSHERLTIIDSDNLVDPEYLNELNKVFSMDVSAVQGVREAKNLNSIYACLDAAGDIYYRYIDRKLLFGAGSSASLAGSGMAFTTKLYIDCLENLESDGAGFDKILQYEILIRKLRIAFAEKAIVFDEKTAKSDQLVKQRARWINTWFKFFKLGLKMAFTGIANLNSNQFLFSVMLLRPPLFITIFFSIICILLDFFLMPNLLIAWFIATLISIFTASLSLKYFNADKKIYDSLKSAPKFMFFQILALFKAKKANELSVATKHDDNDAVL